MKARLNKSIRVTKETMGNYLNSLHAFEESAKHKLAEINEATERAEMRKSRISMSQFPSPLHPSLIARSSMSW